MWHRLLKSNSCATPCRCILQVHVLIEICEALQLSRTETLVAAKGTLSLHCFWGDASRFSEVYYLSLICRWRNYVIIEDFEAMNDLGSRGGHTCTCSLSVQSTILRVVHCVRRHFWNPVCLNRCTIECDTILLMRRTHFIMISGHHCTSISSH